MTEGDRGQLEPSHGGGSWKQTRALAVLKMLDVDLPKSARILDFGCGDGDTLRALSDMGYYNVEGFDFAESPRLSDQRQNITLGSFMDLRVPYANDLFDLVISDQVFEHVLDQVTAFSELYRITKPGGHGLHFIPARYMPLEGHIAIPFGGVLQHRWWYKFWAATKFFRNNSQKERQLSSDEIADEDAFFVVEASRYVPNSCYRVIWPRIGFRYQFAEQEFFRAHERPSMRKIGRLGLPAAWLYRTFRGRVVYLHKPRGAAPPSAGAARLGAPRPTTGDPHRRRGH